MLKYHCECKQVRKGNIVQFMAMLKIKKRLLCISKVVQGSAVRRIGSTLVSEISAVFSRHSWHFNVGILQGRGHMEEVHGSLGLGASTSGRNKTMYSKLSKIGRTNNSQ